MKMTEEEKERVWEKIREIRERYHLQYPIHTDVDERAYKEWTSKHDYIPDIEEIDRVIAEVRADAE